MAESQGRRGQRRNWAAIAHARLKNQAPENKQIQFKFPPEIDFDLSNPPNTFLIAKEFLNNQDSSQKLSCFVTSNCERLSYCMFRKCGSGDGP